VVIAACSAGFVLAALALGPKAPVRSDAAPPGACRGVTVPQARSVTAQVGAYYYDGWSGPLDGAAFRGLASGPWAGRQPLSGWRDDTRAAMAQQLGWARRYGIGFFVFDWYYASPGHSLPMNDALSLYRMLPAHDGVGYALMYVNTDEFMIPRTQWSTVASQWARQFAQPSYERVHGMPVLVILDVARFNEQFGGPTGVDDALAALRSAATAAGLPGVYIVGGVYVDPSFDWNWFTDVVSHEGFDAFTQYSAPAAAGLLNGPQPYTRLVRAIEADWQRFDEAPKPFVPDVVVGWDARPWGSTVNGGSWWFERSPAQVGAFARAATRFAHGRSPVLLEAWNELGEGAFLVPTVGSCHRYGAALAAALGARG
jgi:hypothetical protein